MEKQSFSDFILSLGNFTLPFDGQFAAFEPDNKKEENMSQWLLKQINDSKELFNKEVLDYLDSLYYLEISVLNKRDNPIKIQEALYNYEFYKKLVAYNILNRSYNVLTELKLDDKQLEKKYKSLLVYYRDKIRGDKLVFNLFTDYDTTTIDFYDNMILSPDKMKAKDSKTIERIKKQLEYLKGKIQKEELKEKIELAQIEEARRQKAIKKMYALSEEDEDACDDIYGPLDEDLFKPTSLSPKLEQKRLNRELSELIKRDDNYYYKLSNSYKASSELSNKVKDILLRDFGLQTNDFENKDGILVKKYTTTKINICN